MRDQDARNGLTQASTARANLRHDLTNVERDIKGIHKAIGAGSTMNLATMEPVSLATRLNTLEDKLDALMLHLDVHATVPLAAPAFVVIAGAEEDDE